MKKCIFCSIIKYNKPRHEIIYSDKNHLAFLDLKPSKYGHVLIIPKKHKNFLFDLSEKEYFSLLKITRKIAMCLRKILKPKYIYLFVKGATIKHIHIHLIPTNKHDLGHLPRKKNITTKKSIKIGGLLRKSINSKK